MNRFCFFILLNFLFCSVLFSQSEGTVLMELLPIDEKAKESIENVMGKQPFSGKVLVSWAKLNTELQMNDVLVSINDEVIKTVEQAVTIQKNMFVNQSYKVVFYRPEKDDKGRMKWVRKKTKITSISIPEAKKQLTDLVNKNFIEIQKLEFEYTKLKAEFDEAERASPIQQPVRARISRFATGGTGSNEKIYNGPRPEDLNRKLTLLKLEDSTIKKLLNNLPQEPQQEEPQQEEPQQEEPQQEEPQQEEPQQEEHFIIEDISFGIRIKDLRKTVYSKAGLTYPYLYRNRRTNEVIVTMFLNKFAIGKIGKSVEGDKVYGWYASGISNNLENNQKDLELEEKLLSNKKQIDHFNVVPNPELNALYLKEKDRLHAEQIQIREDIYDNAIFNKLHWKGNSSNIDEALKYFTDSYGQPKIRKYKSQTQVGLLDDYDAEWQLKNVVIYIRKHVNENEGEIKIFAIK